MNLIQDNPDFLFAKAVSSFEEKRPFVLYNKPNTENTIGIFQNNDNLNSVVDFTETGFVFAPFNGNEIILIPENQSEILICRKSEKQFPGRSEVLPELLRSENGHKNLVQKGIDAINNGDFEKVVLSRKEIVNFPDFDFINAFQSLQTLYPTAFVYCWFHPKVGMWLGAFSEQLLKVDGNKLSTMALAGTQKWHENEIIWKEKEKNEQEIVTNFIVDGLKPFAENITISKPFTLKAGSLAHIRTDINVDLKAKSDVKEIISVLHPTPAVCGLPKKSAMDFILENENYNREFYSGFHGELNKDFCSAEKQTDLYVNLRCVQVKDNEASIYVGGGITKDSIPENEWLETVNKTQTIKMALRQK